METNSIMARISAVHRNAIEVLKDGTVSRHEIARGTGDFAVGDWIEILGDRIGEIAPRRGLIQRRAAGTDARHQLVAANVDTLAIVTSCNADFNERRLERYLVLAEQSGAIPIVVLTKSDLTQDAETFRRRAERLSPLVTAMALNATDPEDVARLAPWCRDGQTLTLVGSSGVGKTTLRNALSDTPGETQDIREDDAKGRHTTTARHLVPTKYGGWLIDTPGMRALRLTDVEDGLASVFSDIGDLAARCRFSDCGHDTEPGCAVQEAIASGALEDGRLKNWRKLERENARNMASIAEQRANAKAFGRMVKGAMAQKKRFDPR